MRKLALFMLDYLYSPSPPRPDPADLRGSQLQVSGGRVSPALLSACASDAVAEALRRAGAFLVEPVVLLEVQLLGARAGPAVSHELARRRARLLDCTAQSVRALLPLEQSRGLAGALRSAASGLASFHMQLHDYQPVPEDRLRLIRAENA